MTKTENVKNKIVLQFKTKKKEQEQKILQFPTLGH